MLDENLPAFFLRASSNGVKHHRDIFSSHRGSEPAPGYSVQNIDPSSPAIAHKNCYAAALFDAYNEDVLFGEVLARPGWTQPSLSAEELRRNGGVPPPPQPVLPNEFVVQLYSPDQQVRVEVKEGKWGGSHSYEFSLPQSTFRTPSASNLDRGQSDPASLSITPKLNFVWRKESKLSKDLTCYMTGKSSDALEKKKSRRDPDIAIALWRSMRELTIYEPNLQRLELEDPKGLEVVLLLTAVVVKDLYFSGKDQMRELFNISDVPNERKLSGGGRRLSVAHPNTQGQYPLATHPGQAPARNDVTRNALPKLQTSPPLTKPAQPAPAADPRAQWQIDAETARLKAQTAAEVKAEERRRREREKADEAEARRIRRMVEEEEKAARRKQAEIDKETERLRKQYGVQQVPSIPYRGEPSQPQANSSNPRQTWQGPYMQPIPQRTQVNLAPPQQPLRPVRGSNGLYHQPSASSSAIMMSGANPSASTLNVPGQQAAKKKKSFFGLRSLSDDATDNNRNRLNKKGSAMW